MLTFFYVCFGVGTGYAVISFILGGVLGALNLDVDIGDINADFDADFSMDASQDFGAGGSPSPLKPVVFSVFLTVFGGLGIITLTSLGAFSAISVSGVTGFLAAFLFYRFLIVPLYKMQNTGAVEKQALIGLDARVTEYIPQGGFGKITYFVNGNTYSAPAKSENGAAIDRHCAVVIAYIERNAFFVRVKEA